MSDVVIELPVSLGDEAQAFGSYLSRFMESRSAEAERCAASADAPWFMMRSDPLHDRELKVLTFQQACAAQAFSSGWARVRDRLQRATAA